MRGWPGYHTVGRRNLLLGGAALLASCRRDGGGARPASTGSPEPRWGVQSGDVTSTSAVVWSRADRPARLVVEWDTSPAFTSPRSVRGPLATGEADLCAKLELTGLPPDARVHYRARFEGERASAWIAGALSTAPDLERDRAAPRDVVFAWSGDTNGQGFGIDDARGGMPAYRALLERAPELFIHCGDAIYADNPIPPEVRLVDGSLWRNLVTPAKSRVAEALDDFRGAHLYPRHSAEVRALSAAVPLLSIWDDHEVHNDWFPGQLLEDPLYAERRVDVLAERARRAMFEHAPTLRDPRGPMYRSLRWGSRLELFFVDGRAYRSPNHPLPPEAEQRFFGEAQLGWLTGALTASTATWKVVACNMPLGLVIGSPRPGTSELVLDAVANGDGPPRGRERELARLLRTLKERRVKNLVFVTADVHYAAAHRYAPDRAAFKEMDPFWELVAGPMHAMSFLPALLDDTFGPEVAWASPSVIGTPATGHQYFGLVRIEGKTGAMRVSFVDARGATLHELTLQPDAT